MQTITFHQRLQAASLHLLLSACVLSTAIYLIFWIWYPAPLHIAVGVTQIYIVILIADLIIGPLLTFIVYKHDIKKMRFDLAIIVFVQISAFLFGMFAVAQGRPAWLVFVVDDFELVSPAALDPRSATQINQHTSLWSGPRWKFAQYSTDLEIQQQQKEDEMFLGISLATRLETYSPIEQAAQSILQRSKPLQKLKAFNSVENVEAVLDIWPQATAWLPLKAPEQDMVVLINAQGQPLAPVNLQPWN